MGIYISLGGAGIKSLSRLKAKIYAEYIDKSLFEHENAFLFIDKWVKTNEAFIQSNFLTEHWTDIIKLVAEKLSFPSFHERTFADQATIKQFKTQIEELRTQLVPLN